MTMLLTLASIVQYAKRIDSSPTFLSTLFARWHK